MAITGYEVNVVRFDADGNEQSVPSYDAYNHHYVFFMKGSNWTVRPAAQLPPPAPSPCQLIMTAVLSCTTGASFRALLP